MFNVYAFCLNLDKNLADLNLDRENIHSRELNKIQPTLWNFYFPCNLKSVAYSTEVNNVHQKKKKKKIQSGSETLQSIAELSAKLFNIADAC